MREKAFTAVATIVVLILLVFIAIGWATVIPAMIQAIYLMLSGALTKAYLLPFPFNIYFIMGSLVAVYYLFGTFFLIFKKDRFDSFVDGFMCFAMFLVVAIVAIPLTVVMWPFAIYIVRQNRLQMLENK